VHRPIPRPDDQRRFGPRLVSQTRGKILRPAHSKQPDQRLAAANNSPNAGAIAGASGNLVFLLFQVGAELAIRGYTKEQENEADIYAFMYLKSINKNPKSLVSTLRKVRTSHNLQIQAIDAEEFDSTHPNPTERLFTIENARFFAANPVQTFDAYSKEGELLYTMFLRGACLYKQRDGTEYEKLLVDVKTTAAFKSVTISGLATDDGTKTRSFKTEGKFETGPLDEVGFTFRATAERNHTSLEQVHLRLEEINAAKIKKRESVSTAQK
jgi:hypothetical protein